MDSETSSNPKKIVLNKVIKITTPQRRFKTGAFYYLNKKSFANNEFIDFKKCFAKVWIKPDKKLIAISLKPN